CYAHHFGGMDPVQVMDLYRERFEASPVLDEPHAMICTSVLTADSQAEADYLAGPSRLRALEMRSGAPRRLVSPETAAARGFTATELEVLQQLPATKFVGTPDAVVDEVAGLVDATGAAELMLTGNTYGVEPKLATYRAI